MPGNMPAADPRLEQRDLKAEARRWIRRKRIFYTLVGIYATLSVMWFLIDMADGTESIWFFWPMLGTGVAVGIVGVTLAGVGGLFGAAWENRQVERYVRERRGPEGE